MENNRILPARIKILLSYLNENLSGKEEAIRLTLLSAIARESILLLGSSGLDKIALIRCVATAFRHFYGSGYQCFEYFMNDSSVPEDLRFSGETIAFFDDIWASNPAVLNKLLAIINNKSAFVAAGSKEGDPYKAAEVKRFEALRESFALYVPVNPISNDSAFFKFVESADFCPKPNEEEKAALLGINEIENWQPAIDRVKLSDDAKNLISEIRRKCFDYFVSDFRWKKIVRILKTCAFLNGRNEVDLMDCSLIDYAIPSHIVEDILKRKAIDCKLDASKHEQYKANIFARQKYYNILKDSVADKKLEMEQGLQNPF